MTLQLICVDYEAETKLSLQGDSDSIFEVWFYLAQGRKWDKCELWHIGEVTCEVPQDGTVFPWWKQPIIGDTMSSPSNTIAGEELKVGDEVTLGTDGRVYKLKR